MFRKAIEQIQVRLDILRQFLALLRQEYPGPGLRPLYRRQWLLLQGIYYFPLLERWYRVKDNPRFVEALERHPCIRGAIFWPYLHHAWAAERRFEVIEGHYRLLEGPAALLQAATRGEVALAALRDCDPELQVVLDKPDWFAREGEVVLNLFQGGTRLYSAAFSLGIENGEVLAYVGAIQGSNLEQAAGIYRGLTRALHGLRPRDLTILALRMLCGAMGVGRLLAVAQAARIYESAYFGLIEEGKLQADYDIIWSEQGGRPLGNGFFELSATPAYRDLSEIPSRKRASYRRRYQILDELDRQIREMTKEPR
ncbi:MAG: VirK/YbjX family protein [Gammaproteobacteria bacterium]|nr:VirK/YbjX family protein [Gammaproteobacteria bacterium]MBU1655587.1 VirK/YbjX family protein [Gammaproteobacteria bacterium]MBU1961868.1 VirK/YbjX family protein [Gammaproteobacteria bacterium]